MCAQIATEKSLIPEKPVWDSPDHFSSWNTQIAVADRLTAGGDGVVTMRDCVNSDTLFGEDGWCRKFYPRVRENLIFTVCDGWELPYSKGDTVDMLPYFGSQVFDGVKFAGFGDTPEQRLKTYADKVKECGWRGAGLWICAQEDAANRSESGFSREFWLDRIMWSRYAGIVYWEIDWGNYYASYEFRRFISDSVNELYPELVIEHVNTLGALNDEFGSGTVPDSFNKRSVEYAAFSDVFRTYDITDQLSVPTTLERIACLLRDGYAEKGDNLSLICCEDEVYMAAALGLTVMIMRNPMNQLSDRLDEVTRAVLWHRSAPAYELGGYETRFSKNSLTDDWFFAESDTWYTPVHAKRIKQSAPAIIARGIELPEVSVPDGGEVPFVAASRNPSGAVSVGAFGRTGCGVPKHAVRADVTLNVGANTGIIGVFGYYSSLTIVCDRPLYGKKIYAQDILDSNATDITAMVEINGNTLRLSGELIDKIGLSCASSGDVSEPGLALRVGEPESFEPAPPLLPRTVVKEAGGESTDAGLYVTFFDSATGMVIDRRAAGRGESVNKPEDPQKTGFVFSCWLYDGKPYDFSAPVTGNIVLTALWHAE